MSLWDAMTKQRQPFWGQELSLRRLWAGPVRGHPFSRVALTVVGRVVAVASLLLLLLFAVGAIVFEALLAWNDPGIAASIWVTAALVVILVKRFSRWYLPPPPDRPTSGAGVPIVPRPPVIEGEAEEELPRRAATG